MSEREISITLVGTSLLRNYLNRKGVGRECTASVERSTKCDEVECYDTCSLVDELVNYANENPMAASAELNALLNYLNHLKRSNMLPDEMVIKLIVSDTCGGLVSGEALRRFIVNHLLNHFPANFKVYASVVRVRGLGRKFYDGLLNLFCYVSYVLNCEKEREGERLFFSANLTGGFKPEGAYALIPLTLMALKVRAVYYIHENFRELVLLPILPLSLLTPDQVKLNLLASSPSMEVIEKTGLTVGDYAKRLIDCINYGRACGKGIEHAVDFLDEEKIKREICG